MDKKTFRDMLVIGFAMFATFFGAGNMIFPPSIGFVAGSGWFVALIGFFISAIALPILSIVSTSKNGGFENIAGKVSPTFSKIFVILIMIIVGVIVGVPRTGATAHELGIQPLLPNISPIITSIFFYGISIYFAINPTTVIDKIGKFLTPVLLIILTIIIFTGITSPISSPVDTGLEDVFTMAFTGGYQTGDALGGVVIASVFMSAIIAKGYSDSKERNKMIMLCGGVAGLGLLLVYGGLLYIGATGSSIFPADVEKTVLLDGLVRGLLGKTGITSLGIAVIFACLTTNIGISAAVGQFFSNLLNNKVTYKAIVIILNIFGLIISNIGVENIVKFAIPIFLVIYPVAIVLIIMGLFDQFIPNRGAYIGAVYCTLLVSIFDTLIMYGINIKPIQSFISYLPFSSKGFSWITPAMFGLIIGILAFSKITKEENQECDLS